MRLTEQITVRVDAPSPLVGEGIAGVSAEFTWVRGYRIRQIACGEKPLIRRGLRPRHLLPQGEKGRVRIAMFLSINLTNCLVATRHRSMFASAGTSRRNRAGILVGAGC